MAGISTLDVSLITGETLPARAAVGDHVFAGTLNLEAPLRLEALAVGEDTALAEIVRLMELSEQRRGRYVGIADRVARLYAPVVHSLALATFLGWTVAAGAAWQVALLHAVAVLIITCPCALGLAVPAVQVIASGRLMCRGVLLKSPTALERLAQIDTVVLDKTGTLTEGRPVLVNPGAVPPEALALAAGLAGASRHPLARAVCRAAPDVPVAQGVQEVPGFGLVLATPEGEVRLGRRGWASEIDDDGSAAPELWLSRPGHELVRFAFEDPLRPDAAMVVAALAARGLAVELLSGDREAAVAEAARRLGIRHWRAGVTPAAKCAHLRGLVASGRKVLMIGDGLNDAPALAAATVSLSPTTALDISQTAADAVFQGRLLSPGARPAGRGRAGGRVGAAELRSGLRLQSRHGAAGDRRAGHPADRRRQHVGLLHPRRRQRPAPRRRAPAVSSLLYLIPVALFLGGLGLAAFIWSLRSGQYDDLEGAAHRILFDDEDNGP